MCQRAQFGMSNEFSSLFSTHFLTPQWELTVLSLVVLPSGLWLFPRVAAWGVFFQDSFPFFSRGVLEISSDSPPFFLSNYEVVFFFLV